MGLLPNSGIRPTAITASDYPQRLKECPDAPPLIYYRGSADWNVKHVLSVVGTRRITPYGKDLCRMFCSELASLLPHTLVVSGLAYGVISTPTEPVWNISFPLSVCWLMG